MQFRKNLLVPSEVYSARVDLSHIPIVEQWFYEDIEFFPSRVRESPDFARYCLRMGHAYMANLGEQLRKLHGSHEAVESLGDKGYNWCYDAHCLRGSTTAPLFICAGAGTNISFEIELANAFPQSKIFLLDPSPQAVSYVKSLTLPPNIVFLEKGLAAASGTLSFLKPDVPGLGSLSAKSIVRGTEYFELEVTTITDLVGEYAIDEIHYLKFDIEGCEHDVVRSLASLPSLPRQIAFELDQPAPIWTCEKTLKYAMSLGYEIVSIWGLNVLMRLRENAVTSLQKNSP